MTKKQKPKYTQGDVSFYKIDKLPEGVRLIPGARVQSGEASGHHHHFVAGNTVRVYTDDQVVDLERMTLDVFNQLNKFVVVDAPMDLLHQEHGPIPTEPLIYRVGIVTEWDYENNQDRQVID